MHTTTLLKDLRILALFLSVSFFMAIPAIAQKSTQALFSTMATPATLENKLGKVVRKHQLLTLNKTEFRNLLAEKPSQLELTLPSTWGVLTLDLQLNTSIAPEVFLNGKEGSKKANYAPGLHYTGQIKGLAKGKISLSIFENGDIIGVGFSEAAGGNLVIGRLQRPSVPVWERPVVVYDDLDLLAKNPFTCGAEALEGKQHDHSPADKKAGSSSRANAPANTCRTARNYWEVSHNLYSQLNFDAVATTNFMTALFTSVNQLYVNEQLHNTLSRVQINTMPDNYDLSGSFAVLDGFSTKMQGQGLTEDLGHIFTANNGLGGVAWLDVLCFNDDYYRNAMSDVQLDLQELPLYSWAVSVTAHEMGHNYGSRHTQWCGWDKGNGVIGNIDSCYTQEQAAGSTACYSGPFVPIAGTIMSYCHLTGSIDLAKGFGPLPGNVMRNRFNNASCFSGPPNPVLNILGSTSGCVGERIVLRSTTIPGASYNWTGPNGFTASADSAVIPAFGSAAAGSYNLSVVANGCTYTLMPLKIDLSCVQFTLPTASTTICGDGSLRVQAGFTATANAGTILALELSDAAGNFNTTRSLGTYTGVNTIDDNISLTGLPEGNYRMRLVVTHNGGTGTQILPYNVTIGLRTAQPTVSAPRPICGSGSVNLQAPANGFATEWRNRAGNVVSTTALYTTPTLTATDTFFVTQRETRTVTTGRTAFTDGGFRVPGATVGNLIRVFQPITIVSFQCLTASAGTVFINAEDVNTGQVVATTSVNAVSGFQTLTVNLNIPPGHYKITNEGTTVSMYRSLVTGGYPYTLPAIFDMYSGIAGGTPDTDLYYWFYNLNIRSQLCTSPITAVPVVVSTATVPTITASGDTTFCEGDSATLTSSAGASYLWSTGAATRSITVKNSGSYNVTVTDPACSGSLTSASIQVTARPRPSTPTINYSGDATRCLGDTIMLTASGGTGRYIWSTGDTTTSIKVFTTGRVELRSISATCTSAVTSVPFTFLPKPAAPVILGPALVNVCVGDAITLRTSTGSLINWSTGRLDSVQRVTRPGVFYALASNGPCESDTSNKVAVNFIAPPTTPGITSVGSLALCRNDSVVLTAQRILPGNTILWSSGDTTASITVKQPGTYTVRTASAGTNCLSAASMAVEVVSAIPTRPVLNLTGTQNICEGDSITLTSSTANGYFWNTGARSQSIRIGASGTYSLVVQGPTGCISATSDIVVVNVQARPAKPALQVVQGNFIICGNDSAVLELDNAAGYLWSTGASSQRITVRTGGRYWGFTINASGCRSQSSDTLVVVRDAIPAKPTITVNGNSSFCAGDSVQLTSDPGTRYLWNTGATTRSIWVKTTGIYGVQVGNTNCLSEVSDGASIFAITLPTLPAILRAGDTLKVSGLLGYGLQWLLNGAPIPGATDSIYVATINGNYAVAVTSGTCTKNTAVLPVVTSLPNSVLAGVQVAPNPTSGRLEVVLTGSVPASISFWNALGQEVLTVPTHGMDRTDVDLSRLPAGMYWLHAPGHTKTKVVRQ